MPPRLVVVTDPRWPLEHLVAVVDEARRALPEGALVVQHRDKTSSAEARERAAAAIRDTGARFVVNGAPEDAARVGAHGVHLPDDAPDVAHARRVLGPEAWISVAAHDDDAIVRAAAAGATAALVSPIYETPGKGAPRGEAALARAADLARGRVAIYALGGVDSRRAASCAAAGADGVAVIRAIFDAPDPAACALALTAPFLGRRR